MSTRDLDEINRRLAAIQDELIATPRDDFATRHLLRSEQDKLRGLAADYAVDRDANRSDEELLAELEARQTVLQELGAKLINSAKLAGFDNSASAGAQDGPALNSRMLDAQGADGHKQRIAAIKAVLASRGVL